MVNYFIFIFLVQKYILYVFFSLYYYCNKLFLVQEWLMASVKKYTNNVSGKMNMKQENAKFKQIDLDDLDVQMITPQFLSTKTLKRPLQQQDIHLSKTNPNGLKQLNKKQYEIPTKQYPEVVIFKKDQNKSLKKSQQSLSQIDASQLNIQPAYKKLQDNDFPLTYENPTFMPQKDKNNIFSAMLKKNLKPSVVLKPEIIMPRQQKKMGPAEIKLKQMMRKNDKIGIAIADTKPQHKKDTKKDDYGQVDEQIIEEYDEYGNDEFEKLSVAYESAIRQSIIGQSNIIKESIRESIGASTSKIKESIREDLRSSAFNMSSSELKEEIGEDISASFKRSKGSIEEVYEQVFEEESLSNSLNKSQSKFKKSVKQLDSLSQSQSASKSFRMKTNIIKSLKYAQDITKKEKQFISTNNTNDKHIKDEISKEKNNLKNLKENIDKILLKEPKINTTEQKNKNLYYNFKVQINRLLASDKYQSRLKKLVSFLSVNESIHPSKAYIDDLQENILKNIMNQIGNIRSGKQSLDEVEKIRNQYERNLEQQLRKQQVNFRAEMNQKLSQKDFQLKKMIAELESRMMGRTFVGTVNQKVNYVSGKFDQYEVQSDYSIDSDNISWKADLWQLLPEIQKKKMYEKQTTSVTKFLADLMISQLKEQALERSQLDISFQFPQEYNNLSASFQKKQGPSKTYQEPIKTASKKQAEKKADRSSQFLSDLPKIAMKTPQVVENTSMSSSSQYERPEQNLRCEKTRKDISQKNDMIKILSQYKNLYLKKKVEVIKNVFKVLTSKNPKTQQFLYSSLQEISILTEKEHKKEHQVYIRAYEEQLITNLLAIYNKSLNKKASIIEQEMKKGYDRLVVGCQVSAAEKCYEKISFGVQNSEFNVESLTKDILRKMQITPAALEIVPSEIYMQLKAKKQQKAIKNELVEQIVNILTLQFAKEFPKKKK